MTAEDWKVMSDLEEAFDKITTFDFLLDRLQEAVDDDNRLEVVEITHALNAFYHPYCQNWDDKFKKAWDQLKSHS